MTEPDVAVIADIRDFDKSSGSIVERVIFNNRLLIVIFCAILTIFMGFETTRLQLNANFNGTIPAHDPFMVNYLANQSQLQSQGNALRIAVAADHGTIASTQYLATLQNVTADVLDLPGVNRPLTTSLWTPTTRWMTVTNGGVNLGAVIDSDYDGSPAQVTAVMQNIVKTGRIGELVSSDMTSSMVYAPLMDHDNLTGAPLDYGRLARKLDELKTKYAAQGVTLHITGFAMVVGDMILGVKKILSFFAISVVIASMVLYWFTRSMRCTLLVIACTFVAVTWQLALLPLMGYSLDPYSVLVPFLIFAIGMSHGAQKMNGVMQDIGRGTHKLVAARQTFRRLFVAGFTALACDAVGFAVLCLIDIQEIRELAVIASCGVAVLIFTNLILLPVLLSYIGVGEKAARHSLRAEQTKVRLEIWSILTKFTCRSWAAPAIMCALMLGIVGEVIGTRAQIGNIGDGAPELRQNSSYNQDVRYIQQHYFVSSDSLILLVPSKQYTCTSYDELAVLDRLNWRLDQLPEVQSSSSISSVIVNMTQTMTDDSPKWDTLVARQALINDFASSLPLGYDNLNCSFVPVIVSLNNISDKTLTSVIAVVQHFTAQPENQGPDFNILLAGGNGGIAAATNRVIREANADMLIWIYAAVSILCFITFKSWRAVVCAILPLMLTSILCKTLMVLMGIGITVATLPVVALGVGIGVDYALYILGVMMKLIRDGVPLEEAYRRSLQFTGRIVMLTGLTLSIAVGIWAFAPLKFQADMGVLLAFMFLLNMVGALILLPALASFLLRSSKVNVKRADKVRL